MKSFLQNNDIEIHLMHNEGKSAVAERFIRTFHSTIKMIHVDLKSNTCIDSGKKIIVKILNLINNCLPAPKHYPT